MQGFDAAHFGHEEGTTCALCKKNYVHHKDDICRHCQADADEAFFRIRDYLRDHPNADALELSEQLILDERVVLFLIDSGRLETVKNVSRCTVCGSAVIGMPLCMQCRTNMSRSLDQARQSLISRGAVDPDTGGKGPGPTTDSKDSSKHTQRDSSRRDRQITTNYYKSMKKW